MASSFETGINLILAGAIGPVIKADLGEYAQKKGMPYNEYIKTNMGFLAALLALNNRSGMKVYDVVEDEAFDESAIEARRKGPHFILDDQTHIFFRKSGHDSTGPEGQQYLEMLGDARNRIVPGSRGIVEMNKDTWFKEVFFESDTDVAFLNSFAMGKVFGGEDLLSTEECLQIAAEVNEKYPGRVLTLGSIEPSKEGHLEKLEYNFKELKMDGLKLYPWDHFSNRGWWMDDEKLAYPLWEKCLELGINKIQIHKGLPVRWSMAKYIHPLDADQPLMDFPDLNFVLYHAGFPYTDELTSLVKGGDARPNLYVDIGATFAILVGTPVAQAHNMGKLLMHVRADHICWGTDTPLFGSPQWAIEAMRKLTIPMELTAGYGYPQITDEDKELIFGKNMARLYGLDVDATKNRIKGDKLSQAKAAAL